MNDAVRIPARIINERQAISAGINPAIYKGDSPFVGTNGNWWVGTVDTGVCAQGAEADRTAAETGRTTAETGRVSAESARATAEQGRIAAETARVANEQARQTGETARTSAESARTTAEQGRVTAETGRVTAETGRTTAETGRLSAESARTTNDAARQVAFAAAQSAATALSGMTVAAAPVAAGAAATATVSDVAGHKHVAFGIPTGLTGNGIASFARTAGTGAAGTTDTYTLTMTDGSTKTVPIYNGRDGQGAGDMLASKYDPDGDGSVNRADIAGALDARAQVALAQVTGLADALTGKQPAQAGKGLSANDLTDARVTHYDAAYTHAQAPHAPTTQATPTAPGIMSAADKGKLDGVAAGANNYAHPVGDGNLHIPATSTNSGGKVLKAGATAGSAAWGTMSAADVGAEPVGTAGTKVAAHNTASDAHAELFVGKANVTHNQGAGSITEGTLAGKVEANTAAQSTLSAGQVRNIYAGTAEMSPGVTALATGTIYLMYE